MKGRKAGVMAAGAVGSWMLACATPAAGAAAASNTTAPQRAPPSALATPKPDDRLIDQDGQRVSPAQLDGHWLLVYFGYADCPDLCPASLMRMRQLLDRLGPAGNDLLPLFVSVNPRVDTPARLKRFASQFHPRLRALTGSEAAIADAARTFGVPVKRVAGKNLIDHGLFTYLADPSGRVVAILNPTQSVDANLEQIRTRLGAAHR